MRATVAVHETASPPSGTQARETVGGAGVPVGGVGAGVRAGVALGVALGVAFGEPDGAGVSDGPGDGLGLGVMMGMGVGVASSPRLGSTGGPSVSPGARLIGGSIEPTTTLLSMGAASR